jgi:hypothetical protein
MFKFIVNRLPWRGEEIKARIEQSGREGARLAAEFVAERARIYAPIDTGELRASISVLSSQGGSLWHVVATAKHARWVEYGSMHGNTFISPNPFMRRAMADGRREFPRLLKEAMVTARQGQHLGATFRAA